MSQIVAPGVRPVRPWLVALGCRSVRLQALNRRPEDPLSAPPWPPVTGRTSLVSRGDTGKPSTSKCFGSLAFVSTPLRFGSLAFVSRLRQSPPGKTPKRTRAGARPIQWQATAGSGRAKATLPRVDPGIQAATWRQDASANDPFFSCSATVASTFRLRSPAGWPSAPCGPNQYLRGRPGSHAEKSSKHIRLGQTFPATAGARSARP